MKSRTLLLLIVTILFLPIIRTPLGLEAQTRASVPALYEQGRVFMMEENWYGAAECFIECLRINSAHAEATAALAECYHELGEFDEALVWVRKARSLARGSTALANLEAFTLIALGRLDEAAAIVDDILRREPYNREALFASGELDIARGRAGSAVIRYRDAVSRFPDDRRLLISLALVLGSLGDTEQARMYIERALRQHEGDYRVYYYAAYLASQTGRLTDAIAYIETALYYRPGHTPSRALLASLRYRDGQYREAARIADELINRNRNDALSWYLKGISYVRMGLPAEAVTILSTAANINPDDEFIRAALTELLISETRLENPVRARWASWHFDRARSFRTRNFMDDALFEYRRGLRLNPYSPARRDYAELLRLQGYPARFLEELRFMQNLGIADKSINDAVESYTALLSSALFRRWGVDPVMIQKPHWNVAIFTLASGASFYHADAGAGASSYMKDLLVHDRSITPMNLELRQPSFSAAFRSAREGGADYFLILSVSENERDISIKGELFVARTGSRAAVFTTFNTGSDRLRNASRNICRQLAAALPFRAELIGRRQGEGLIDKGRLDSVKNGDAFEIIRKNGATLLHEGIGIEYSPDDIVGKLIIERADEEVAAGTLTRAGFFDRISVGDDVFLVSQRSEGSRAAPLPADPELRSLLRALRIDNNPYLR